MPVSVKDVFQCFASYCKPLSDSCFKNRISDLSLSFWFCFLNYSNKQPYSGELWGHNGRTLYLILTLTALLLPTIILPDYSRLKPAMTWLKSLVKDLRVIHSTMHDSVSPSVVKHKKSDTLKTIEVKDGVKMLSSWNISWTLLTVWETYFLKTEIDNWAIPTMAAVWSVRQRLAIPRNLGWVWQPIRFWVPGGQTDRQTDQCTKWQIKTQGLQAS